MTICTLSVCNCCCVCHLLRTVFLLLRESRKGASSRKRAQGYFAFLEGCNKFQLALFVPMVAASVRSNAVFSYSSPVRMVEQSSFTLTFLSGVGLVPSSLHPKPRERLSLPRTPLKLLLHRSLSGWNPGAPVLLSWNKGGCWPSAGEGQQQPGTQSSSLGGCLCKVAQSPSL